MEKKVKTFYEYLHLLENEVIKNDGNPLSDTQVNRFISVYNLGVDWNITLADVKADLKEYYQKWLLSLLQKRARSNQSSMNQMNSKNGRPVLTQNDRSVSDQIRNRIRSGPDITRDRRRMVSLVADLLANQRLEKNILTILLQEGILNALEDQFVQERDIVGRYRSILQNYYGMTDEIAERMVRIWILVFRQKDGGKES